MILTDNFRQVHMGDGFSLVDFKNTKALENRTVYPCPCCKRLYMQEQDAKQCLLFDLRDRWRLSHLRYLNAQNQERDFPNEIVVEDIVTGMQGKYTLSATAKKENCQ